MAGDPSAFSAVADAPAARIWREGHDDTPIVLRSIVFRLSGHERPDCGVDVGGVWQRAFVRRCTRKRLIEDWGDAARCEIGDCAYG
jgi:hypothetical protein